MATKLVEQWLKIVKGESVTTDSTPTVETAVPAQIHTNDSNSTEDVESTEHREDEERNGSNMVFIDPRASDDHDNDSNDGGDPLAFSSETAPEQVKSLGPKSNNETLVYKITVKDGKQILAKVDNGQKKSPLVQRSGSTSPKITSPKSSSGQDDTVDSKTNKEKQNNSNLSNSNNSVDKSDKSDKDVDHKDRYRDKSKSSSSRDKEREKMRDRDRKGSDSSLSRSDSKSDSKSSSKKHSSSSTHRSNSSHSHKSSRSSRDSKEKTGNSDKYKSSSSKSSSSNSSSSNRDKSSSRSDKEKDTKSTPNEPKVSQADKDKDTLTKVMSQSLSKLGKIPKKINSGEDSIETATSSKKPSISIEVRKDTENRPKTVKTFHSQFRSHGLAEEAPPPPSRRGLKKPTSTPVPGTTILSSIGAKRLSISPTHEPEKKPKLESPIVEKPGAIKLIPPKPKRKYQFQICILIVLFCRIFSGHVLMSLSQNIWHIRFCWV